MPSRIVCESHQCVVADSSILWIAVASQLAVLALIARKYRLLMRPLGHRLGWRLLVRVHLRRHVVATVGPFDGPPSMILFARDLRSHGVSTGNAVYMTVRYGVAGNAGFLRFLGPVLLWLANAGQLTARSGSARSSSPRSSPPAWRRSSSSAGTMCRSR